MTKKEQAQLVALLKQLYGDAWQFEWQGEDDGFSLTLQVNHNQEPTCT
jgi:hypothetical protein